MLNMKFFMTDIQFAPLNSILLLILNILRMLANILPAEYSNEYPAGWSLLATQRKERFCEDADYSSATIKYRV